MLSTSTTDVVVCCGVAVMTRLPFRCRTVKTLASMFLGEMLPKLRDPSDSAIWRQAESCDVEDGIPRATSQDRSVPNFVPCVPKFVPNAGIGRCRPMVTSVIMMKMRKPLCHKGLMAFEC